MLKRAFEPTVPCWAIGAGFLKVQNKPDEILCGRLANKLFLKVADLAAIDSNYYKSIEHYEKVAKSSVSNYLMKWSVKEYLLKAGICHLAANVNALQSRIFVPCPPALGSLYRYTTFHHSANSPVFAMYRTQLPLRAPSKATATSTLPLRPRANISSWSTSPRPWSRVTRKCSRTSSSSLIR